jgi:phosphoglycerate dehydrogenase-like enzyme
MSQPLVSIVCPFECDFTDTEASVERPILEGVAQVETVCIGNHDPLPDAIRGSHAIILWHGPRMGREVILGLRNCRAIVRNGVGYDTVDLDAAIERGIAVCNIPDYGTEEVADHALALVLALYRQLFPLDAEAKGLGWRIKSRDRMRRLRTQTLGIVGLGRIGTATALRAKAFGFRVVFFDPYVPRGIHKAVGVERVDSLEELLSIADVVSIHCPLTAETRGFIGERELALMKPTAFLVNTARGDIVQKAPLFRALREGRLAGAGLDVVEDEPLRDPEEAATPHLIVTCHAAFCSPEGLIEMRSSSARIARAAVLGEPVWNRVNGPAASR